MSPRTVFLPALLALGLLPYAPAHATITYSFGLSQTDPGQPGGTIIDNFGSIDTAPQSSYFITGNGVVNCAAITGTTQSCNSAIGSPPIVAGQPDTGLPPGVSSPYLAVNNGSDQTPGNVGFFQISLANLNSDNVSFYWGSVDQWNFVQLLDAQGNALETVHGSDLGATFNNGQPMSPGSGRFTFDWSGSDPVATLQFGDTFGPAFEVANVSTANAVPEPASLGLLAAGLGMLSQVRSRRRRPV